MQAPSDPQQPGSSRPDWSGSAAAEAFVGRTAELASLEADLAQVAPLDGPVRMLCGPVGVGKTRLAEELARSARRSGYQVAWAHCPNDLTAPPYWPWAQVVRSLLGFDRGTELAPLVLDDPEGADRFELFDATAATLRDAAFNGPVLVVLDDLQAADEATLQLTQFVARQLHHLPVLVVATVRTSPSVDAAFATHLDVLGRSGQRLELGPLGVEAIADLVAGSVPSDDIHAVTGGNPLHVHQVLRELRASSWATSEAVPYEALRRAVDRRIDAVSGPTRGVLEAAAVLGSPFVRGELRRLFIDVDSEGGDLANEIVIDAALDELDERGFVKGHDGRFVFRHPLLVDALLDALEAGDGHRLHGTVAGLIGDEETRVGEQAHHLLRAGPAHSLAAVDACRRAARVASRSLAHEDAAVHLARAFAVLKDAAPEAFALEVVAVGDPVLSAPVPNERAGNDPDVIVRLRLDVSLELGDAYWRAGQTQLADEMHEQAWLAARRLGDPTSLARAVLHNGLEYYFSDHARPVLAARTEEALAAQPPGVSTLRSRLLADLATHHLVSTVDQGRRLAAESVAMARQVDDPVALGNALIARQITDLGPATLRRRVADAHEILACASEADDYRLALHGRFLLMGALLEGGDIRTLDGELARLDGGLGDLGEPRFERFGQWLQASQALLDGRGEDAESLAETALGISVRMSDPDAAGVYGGQVGVARWLQGRTIEMEPVYLAMRAEQPDEPMWSAVLAWLWATHGRPDAARGSLDAVPDPATLGSGMHWLLTASTFAGAAALVGTDAQVDQAWSALLPYAEHIIPIAMGAAVWGPVALPLGRLAMRRGQHEVGLDLLAGAVRTCARIGARPWLIEAQLDLAEALAEHRPGDQRIDPLRFEASAAVEQLGLDVFRPHITATSGAARTAVTRDQVAGASGGDDEVSDPRRSGASGTPSRPPAPERSASARPAVRVIGGFDVTGADGATARWTSRKARKLLKILVSRRGAPVNREELCDLLWPGEDPAAVANRLSVALSTIRRALDPQRLLPADDLVSTQVDVATLRLDGIDVDVEDLLVQTRSVLESARRGEPDAPKLAMTLLDRHRGEAFPDEPHADWATALRSEAAMAMTSLARLVASDAAARDDHLQAAEAHRRILDVDPYDEAANLGLTVAFRAMRAHGQADAAYTTYRERMKELGVTAALEPQPQP